MRRVIPKAELKKGHYYIGPGRGSHVAVWTGDRFVWPGMEWNDWALQEGNHYDDGGCFAPIKEILDNYPSVMQFQEGAHLPDEGCPLCGRLITGHSHVCPPPLGPG